MTHFLGICDICHVVLTFNSAEAREFWEQNHPHVEDE